MRHTLTPTQTSNQVHKPKHRQPHSATVLGKCLTTICACGKRRVRAEAASHADAGAAAGDVLEPYLCLRLVLAFYLFALFVCAVCLPQQSTWNLCADVLAKLPADTHTYTQTKTNPHTHPHLAHHTHTHTGTLVCLRIWLGSHFNCQSVWEINVCVARSSNSCVQFSNWSAAQLPLSPAWQRATWVSSSLPFICIKAARTCTSASYRLALPLSNSQLVFNQATSLVI